MGKESENGYRVVMLHAIAVSLQWGVGIFGCLMWVMSAAVGSVSQIAKKSFRN
jgi:hypothetical protein